MKIRVRKKTKIHILGMNIVERHAGIVMKTKPLPPICRFVISREYFWQKYPRYPKMITDANRPVKLFRIGILIKGKDYHFAGITILSVGFLKLENVGMIA